VERPVRGSSPGPTVSRLSRAAALALLPACWTAAWAGAGPTIEGLAIDRRAGRLLVAYRVGGAMTDEVVERIRSGMPVAFEHEVEIVARRVLWTARVVARERRRVEVTYDPLTRRHALRGERVRRLAGGPDGPAVAERAEAESLVDVEAWLTDVRVEWPDDVVAGIRAERLRVRVESSVGRRFVLWLFPGRQTASAERWIAP